MSKRLKDNLPLISFLTSDIPTVQLKLVLASLTKEQVNAISEIAANVLYGNIPISAKHKKLLRPFKSKIEAITSKSFKERKRLITKEVRTVKATLQAARTLLKTLLE